MFFTILQFIAIVVNLISEKSTQIDKYLEFCVSVCAFSKIANAKECLPKANIKGSRFNVS